MDKDFLKHYLKKITHNAIEIQQQMPRLSFIENELISIRKLMDTKTNNIKLAICTMLGLFENEEDNNSNSILITCNGFDNQFNIQEEIRKMIIELKIKGSIRTRNNGLIELRTSSFGSIYGRTKEEIEQKLINKLKEAKNTKSTKNKTPLLSEFYYEKYLPYKKANLAENSIKAIQSNFKSLACINKPLNKYTANEIENFLYSIPQTRKRQVLQGLLNNIFTYAKRLEYIKINPCENVEKMKHTKKIGRALSFKDQCAFFNYLYSPTNKTSIMEKFYITFVYLTGTRRNEALSITPSDVNFNTNIIHIPGTKTATSNRTIPMFPLVKKLLQTMEFGKNKVFDIKYNQVKNTIEKITKEYHLHELRHTFGTICICVEKLDPKTVSLYMGHSNPYTTLNTYTHPEQLDETLFFDGSLSEKEKIEKLKAEYKKILQIINEFLDSYTQKIPKK